MFLTLIMVGMFIGLNANGDEVKVYGKNSNRVVGIVNKEAIISLGGKEVALVVVGHRTDFSAILAPDEENMGKVSLRITPEIPEDDESYLDFLN